MSEPWVQIDRDTPAVTILTLNRPEKRNALSTALMDELCAAVTAACEDVTQRVIILRGAGPVFCAGLDLKEASAPGQAEPMVALIGRVLEVISGASLVTIAAAHGVAAGGVMGGRDPGLRGGRLLGREHLSLHRAAAALAVFRRRPRNRLHDALCDPQDRARRRVRAPHRTRTSRLLAELRS